MKDRGHGPLLQERPTSPFTWVGGAELVATVHQELSDRPYPAKFSPKNKYLPTVNKVVQLVGGRLRTARAGPRIAPVSTQRRSLP